MSLAALLNQTVTLRRYVGEAANGPVFAEPVEVVCRLEDAVELVRAANGDEVTSSARAFFTAETDVPVESIVELDGVPRTVIKVERAFGARSAHHLQVALK